MSVPQASLSVALAAGGTAGHVEPALAVADALRADDPRHQVVIIGTPTGLENRLVPARGHRLDVIPRVPLPRRATPDLLKIPGRLGGATRAAGLILDREQTSVVVGFGGYASLPVYLAARRRRIPVVVHEANARAGLANRIGSRLAAAVAVANLDCGLRGAVLVGIPLRRSIVDLDRTATRTQARQELDLDLVSPVLLVSGGSSGARSLNQAVVDAAAAFAESGVQVLHHAGLNNVDEVRTAVAAYPNHHVVDYIDRMDLAYAAADLMLCRAGAMTCAELAAVGLPAVYVPLPIGNGEQRLNALPVVHAGGGLLVADADLDSAYLERDVLPLLLSRPQLEVMSDAARATVAGDAARTMVEIVRRVSGKMDQ